MKQFLKVTLAIVSLSASLFAANPNGATATNTVSGSIALQVSVNTAVRLSFAAGTTAVNGGAACALGGSVVVGGTPSDVSFNLDLSGKGRRDKWQEYRFVWTAKKAQK